MNIVEFKDYKILDMSNGEKVESWNGVIDQNRLLSAFVYAAAQFRYDDRTCFGFDPNEYPGL